MVSACCEVDTIFRLWLSGLKVAGLEAYFSETVERVVVAAITQSGETGNPHVETDNAALWLPCFNFAPSLNRHKPLAARLTDRDIAYITQNGT